MQKDNQLSTTRIALFKGRKIRKIIYNNEWWFSVIDVAGALTDSVKPRVYWNAMKTRVKSEDGFQLSTICRQLKLRAPDGKMRKTDCANTEGIFRIIQSIPSPKVEPLKRWLARVGYERVKEIEDPELATKRTHAIYKAKGYSESWIAKRMRGIEVRETLTNEWKKRGAKKDVEYSILTAEISKATFGMTPSEYKKFKGLKRENLRDHMDDLELILTMLGEATTTKITKDRNSKGFIPLKKDAKDGGNVAGRTKKDIESQTGKSVSTRDNFLELDSSKKLTTKNKKKKS